MGRVGIGPGIAVVAYDDQAGATAARLWYVLRAHGHDEVAVLDGGLAKWTAEGRALETAEALPEPRAFVPHTRDGMVVGKAGVAGALGHELVFDARVPGRYRGETEPIDSRPGHIPGARNAPFTDNLTGDPVPVFRTAADLRARFVALGADRREPIVYCGSGVTACHDLLALEIAGLRGRLYAGSWSEWSADPALPAALGAEAGE